MAIAPDALDADELYRRYQDLAWEEQLTLDQFLERASRGEYGSVARDDIDRFLRFLLQTLLDNIELKARENPTFRPRMAETIRNTEEEFDVLFDRYT